MLPYFWYILKVIICSGILFGYYWLFLRNKIFHQYNRFYLLSAMILSLLLPLLKIDFWLQTDTPQASVIKVLQAVSAGDEYMSNVIITANKTGWSFQQLFPLLYWMISIVFFLILVKTLFAIRSLLKRYPVQEIEKVSFVNTNDKSTPFSFFKYIFWNVGIDMDTYTGKQIFKHEVAHIQEKHTHDKLSVNILLIFFWCNPFFWLYRKELNMIHEFIADKKAVEDSDTASFAAMILQATYPQHRFEISNNFFYSPIKRRLLMLTKNKNPKVNYIARVMVLPLAVLVFAAFTFKVKKSDKNSLNMNEQAVVITDTIPAGMYVNVIKTDSIYMAGSDFKNKALVFVDSKEIGNFGINYIETSTDKFSSVVIYGPDEAKKIYGDKGRYGVIKLTKKDLMLITAENVTYDEKTKSIKLSGTNPKINGDMSNAVIYLDGIEITPVELNKISPERVSTINILKGEKLDEVAETKGKSAIINVTLKPSDLQEVVVTGYPINKEPLAAIALDKMNVLYIGVDNPVTIAVEGIPSDKLIVYMENGSIRGSNGKYIAKVTSTGTATINVATIKNDKKVLLSTQTFRVKRIPDPVNGQVPIDFEIKFKQDNELEQLKEKQIALQLDQNKAKLNLAQQALVYKDLQEKELLAVKQNIQLAQQYKTKLDLAEKTIDGVKLKNMQDLALKEHIVLGYQSQSKLENELAQKTLEEVKLASLANLGVQQKLLLEKQNKTNLQLEEKTLLNKITDSLLMKTLSDQKKLLLSQPDINNLVFVKTEVSPMFTGGDDAWRKYLEKNLDPRIPMNDGWKAGKYTVIVKFIVRMDGTVSDVGTENYKGSKTSKHCISIIQQAPKWQPAIQNGKKVNAWKKQPITFIIEEQP